MNTYNVSAATGVVPVQGDTVQRTPEGWLHVFQTGQTDPVAFFQSWNYYTVEPVVEEPSS